MVSATVCFLASKCVATNNRTPAMQRTVKAAPPTLTAPRNSNCPNARNMVPHSRKCLTEMQRAISDGTEERGTSGCVADLGSAAAERYLLCAVYCVLSDTPRTNALAAVAPGVLFNFFAMFVTPVFCFASNFNVFR